MNEQERLELQQQFLKQAMVHEEQCRLNYEMAKANTRALQADFKKAG